MSYRTQLVAFATLLTLGVGAGAGILDAAMYPGKVTSFYGDRTSSADRGELMRGLKDGKLAENFAATAQATLLLKHNLAVGVAECGHVNAFFQPKDSSVTICLELVEFIVAEAAREGIMRRPKASQFVAGVLIAIFTHELAHALIYIDRIPITGREEDVADQFSLYYSLRYLAPGGLNSIGPGVWYFNKVSQLRGAVGTLSEDEVRRLMSNEHSLDQQRVFNFVCWAYGANPSKAQRLADFVQLSEQRKERCSGEYAQLDVGIRRQFGRFLRR